MQPFTRTATGGAVAFGFALCALLGATSSRPAHASFHTYQISELYSNASGSVQFIELHEASGFNGQNFLAGHTITVTQGPTVHSFTFPADLPSFNTANTRVLIATPGFAALGIVTPDYPIPAGFLFTAGGASVNYAGVDSLTYATLPSDGVHSLGRNDAIGVNSPTNFAGQTGSIAPAPPPPPPAAAASIPALEPWGIFALTLLLLAAVAFVLRKPSRN